MEVERDGDAKMSEPSVELQFLFQKLGETQGFAVKSEYRGNTSAHAHAHAHAHLEALVELSLMFGFQPINHLTLAIIL